MTAKHINNHIKAYNIPTDDISDGFHTFGELYQHRILLFICLLKMTEDEWSHLKGKIWKSERHSDGELAFGGGWFVLGIDTNPGKQITYHLPMSYWPDCDFAETLETAPEWDGHTSNDVLDRLRKLFIE